MSGWLLILLAVDAWFMVRNVLVRRYRSRLIVQAHRAGCADLERGRPPLWRMEAFETQSYAGMVLRLWRRIDSFYPDRSFLDPDSLEPARDR